MFDQGAWTRSPRIPRLDWSDLIILLTLGVTAVRRGSIIVLAVCVSEFAPLVNHRGVLAFSAKCMTEIIHYLKLDSHKELTLSMKTSN